MGAWPPATTIASNLESSSSDTLRVFSISGACFGELTKPSVIKSSAEYPLASRGSLILSASHFPPFGLNSSSSYPFSVIAKYGCVSSLHQKPTGHPVVVDTAGFASTIATRFRFLALVTFGSLRLMGRPPDGELVPDRHPSLVRHVASG